MEVCPPSDLFGWAIYRDSYSFSTPEYQSLGSRGRLRLVAIGSSFKEDAVLLMLCAGRLVSI